MVSLHHSRCSSQACPASGWQAALMLAKDGRGSISAGTLLERPACGFSQAVRQLSASRYRHWR